MDLQTVSSDMEYIADMLSDLGRDNKDYTRLNDVRFYYSLF